MKPETNPIPCTFTLQELTIIKKDVEHVLNMVTLNKKEIDKRIELLNKINEFARNGK